MRVYLHWGLVLLAVHAVLAPLLILLRTFRDDEIRYLAARVFDVLYFFIATPMNSHRCQEVLLTPLAMWFSEVLGFGFLFSIAAGEIVLSLILGGIFYFLVGCLLGRLWSRLYRKQNRATAT